MNATLSSPLGQGHDQSIDHSNDGGDYCDAASVGQLLFILNIA